MLLLSTDGYDTQVKLLARVFTLQMFCAVREGGAEEEEDVDREGGAEEEE